MPTYLRPASFPLDPIAGHIREMNATLSTSTYGLVHTGSARPPGVALLEHELFLRGEHLEALYNPLANYKEYRQNSTHDADQPYRKFPGDGKYRSQQYPALTLTTPPGSTTRYDEGPQDRAWMIEIDRNYRARLWQELREMEHLQHSSENLNEKRLTSQLRQACRKGDLLQVYSLLMEAKAANIDPHNNQFGDTPLHEACRAGHLPVVNCLLKGGANNRAIGAYGNTPLHEACRPGGDHLAIVRRLLENAKDQLPNMVQEQNDDGETPLDIAMDFLHYFDYDDVSEIAAFLLMNGATLQEDRTRRLSWSQWNHLLRALQSQVVSNRHTKEIPCLTQFQVNRVARGFIPRAREAYRLHRNALQQIALNRLDRDRFQLRFFAIQESASEAYKGKRFLLLRYTQSSAALLEFHSSKTLLLDEETYAELAKQICKALWDTWQNPTLVLLDGFENFSEYPSIQRYFINEQENLFHLYALYNAIKTTENQALQNRGTRTGQCIAQSVKAFLSQTTTEKWEGIFHLLYRLSTTRVETEQETAAYNQLTDHQCALLETAQKHFSCLLEYARQADTLERYLNKGPEEDILLNNLREQAFLRTLYFLNLHRESHAEKKLIDYEKNPDAREGLFLVPAGSNDWYHKVPRGQLDFNDEEDLRFATWIQEGLEEQILLDGTVAPLIEHWVEELREIDETLPADSKISMFLDAMILYWQGARRRYFQDTLSTAEKRESLLIESLDTWQRLYKHLLLEKIEIPASIKATLNEIHSCLLQELENSFQVSLPEKNPDSEEQKELFINHFKAKLRGAIRSAEILPNREIGKAPSATERAIKVISQALLGIPAALELLLVLGKESHQLYECAEVLHSHVELAPELGHTLEATETAAHPLVHKIQHAIGSRSLEDQWLRMRQAFTFEQDDEFIDYLSAFIGNVFSEQLKCLNRPSTVLLANWCGEQLINGVRLVDLLEKMNPLKKIEEKAEFFTRFLMTLLLESDGLVLHLQPADPNVQESKKRIRLSNLFRFDGVRCYWNSRGEKKEIILSRPNAPKASRERTRCALPSEIRSNGKKVGWYYQGDEFEELQRGGFDGAFVPILTNYKTKEQRLGEYDKRLSQHQEKLDKHDDQLIKHEIILQNLIQLLSSEAVLTEKGRIMLQEDRVLLNFIQSRLSNFEKPNVLTFKHTTRSNQHFFRPSPENFADSADPRHYTDDRVNALLNHYLPNELGRIDAIDLRQLKGTTLESNLRDRERQYPPEIVPKVILPVNLGGHWAALYFHRRTDDYPMVSYCDPLGHPIPKLLEKVIGRVYPGIPLENIICPEIQFQIDNYNCGPWIVAILTSLFQTGHLPNEGISGDGLRIKQSEDLQEHGNQLPRQATLGDSTLVMGSILSVRRL